LRSALSVLGINGADTEAIVDWLEYNALGAVSNVRSMIQQADAMLQVNVLQAVESMNAILRPPTEQFQETWRFVPIAIIFAFNIILAGVASVLCWRLHHPKSASLAVALLWLMTALLLLVGAGVMNGAYEVGQDSCLYGETFVSKYAGQQIDDSFATTKISKMLKYYIGDDEIPDNQVVKEISGVDVSLVQESITSPLGSSLAAIMQTPVAENVLKATGISEAGVAAIQNAVGLAQPINSALQELELGLLRSSVLPLYEDVRGLFTCCCSPSFD
jgi:hypothetical protein